MSKYVAVLPHVGKSIVSVRLWSMCPSELLQSNDSYAGAFSHSVKMRGLLEYVYANLWEYVFIVMV